MAAGAAAALATSTKLLFNFGSSTDSKTATFICCSNTIMRNETELIIPCSQINQCES